ncbi:hypothetical protein Dda_4649 [Drechslerella dactyloides]|uniref:Prion-inhibition and propagation HeLo domain-containing protein n=1 Tax=Drechslerella dactyloides TaxID=74499 RepID=A0AAD6NKT4_DREDA|nr:hypothetical protein Dda_4649 [Drechslerella dactyloides]
MDPLSVAGLALGAVGLTFQIFSGCVTAYQLLLDANGMPEKYHFLWVRLQMEQHKLLDWGKISNLSEDDATISPSLHRSRHLINDVLHQIEALLLNIDGLSNRYKLKLVVDDPPPYSETERQTSLDNAAQRASSGQAIKAKALDLIARSRRYPARLRWAAFDRDKFETLLADLTVLNDSMMYFLETDQKAAAYELQRTSFMQILQVSNKVDELIGLVSSLEVSGKMGKRGSSDASIGLDAVPGETLTDSNSTSSTRITHEQRLLQLARFKALSIAVEQSPDDPLAVGLRKSITDNLELDADELVSTTPGESAAGGRTLYSYRGASVWVEWKTYMAQGLDSLPPSYVEDRVRKLAALLRNEQKPREFRVPDCLGYVHQPELERFGYVFCWPKEAAAANASAIASPPVSLHALLRSLDYPPPLGSRIAIMRAVATSIWYLHATNWLHKGLQSENIIFRSAPEANPHGVLLSDPFVEGFEYSRPAEAGERTERPAANSLYRELYRHPHAQFDLPREATGMGLEMSGNSKRRGFRKIYDVYALGVVLLEVALWEPVHALVGVRDENAVTAREARGAWAALAEKRAYEGRLRAMVGDMVAEIVVACITGNLVDSREKDAVGVDGDVLLQTALGDKVVKRLDDVVV